MHQRKAPMPPFTDQAMQIPMNAQAHTGAANLPGMAGQQNRAARARLGSNPSESNFDYFSKVDASQQVHPFVLALNAQGQAARVHKTKQSSQNSLSSQDIQLALGHRGALNGNDSNLFGHQDTSYSGQKASAIPRSREHANLLPTGTGQRVGSKPSLGQPADVPGYQRMKTMEGSASLKHKSNLSGHDAFGKDAGGAKAPPHKKLASLISAEGTGAGVANMAVGNEQNE